MSLKHDCVTLRKETAQTSGTSGGAYDLPIHCLPCSTATSGRERPVLPSARAVPIFPCGPVPKLEQAVLGAGHPARLRYDRCGRLSPRALPACSRGVGTTAFPSNDASGITPAQCMAMVRATAPPEQAARSPLDCLDDHSRFDRVAIPNPKPTTTAPYAVAPLIATLFVDVVPVYAERRIPAPRRR